MKADDVSHVNVLYAPEAAKTALSDLRATPTDNPDLPYRIDVKNHVRNREGYKSNLMLDIAALRRLKCIIDFIPTDTVKAEIAAGKRDPKTFAEIKKSVAGTPRKSPSQSAA